MRYDDLTKEGLLNKFFIRKFFASGCLIKHYFSYIIILDTYVQNMYTATEIARDNMNICTI